jgi:hypothetical protein
VIPDPRRLIVKDSTCKQISRVADSPESNTKSHRQPETGAVMSAKSADFVLTED